MSSLSDSEDEPSQVAHNNYATPHNMYTSRLSESGDSSEDEGTMRSPAKRLRSSTNEYSADEEAQMPSKRNRSNTLGACSQSSSGTEYTSTSDHQSQADSDNETPTPTFGSFQYQQFTSIKVSQPHVKVSGIGERMLKNAGYVEGSGLGKYGQGRVEPIATSTQRGRTGLGFQAYSKGRGYGGPAYNPSVDQVTALEEIIWMESSVDERINDDLLLSWMRQGPRKMTIDDELEFCDESILQDVLSLKTGLDDMPGEDLRRVTAACNPFEKIGSVFFINRAALKMANMDAVFDFIFTKPRDRNGMPLVKDNELLYFADVCAGPGGFTEYVLWRKKWKARGFGFTLKSMNDFKLGDLHACSTETFTPYYGVNGDGDVFSPENIESLKDFVLTNTNYMGVHFMMADGGFSVEGQENIQEILSKQLYLCQCLVALCIVRIGGNFVVKLFDLFTEFSVGLVYLMYRCFDRVCIHKPNTSRPANSERYLICKGKRECSDTIERYLFTVNQLLCRHTRKKDLDVTHLVPLEVIKDDQTFFDYIRDSNRRIGDMQKLNLLKVIECYKDPSKYEETRHKEMRMACLKLWNVPDLPKSAQLPCGPIEAFKSVLSIVNEALKSVFDEKIFKKLLKFKPQMFRSLVDLPKPKAKFAHHLDWKFVYLSNLSDETTDNKFSFYLGSAGCNAYELVGNSWKINHDIRLPADTLILAEKVQENLREGPAMKRHAGVHIIDAMVLGGKCVLNEPINKRYETISLFCEAHSTPEKILLDPPRIPLRCKRLYDMKDLPEELDNLMKRQVKKLGRVNATSVSSDSDLYYVTKSILFIKTTKEPWVKVFSSRHKVPYFYNKNTKESLFECPPAIMNALDTLENYSEWPNLQDDQYKRDPLFHELLQCTT